MKKLIYEVLIKYQDEDGSYFEAQPYAEVYSDGSVRCTEDEEKTADWLRERGCKEDVLQELERLYQRNRDTTTNIWKHQMQYYTSCMGDFKCKPWEYYEYLCGQKNDRYPEAFFTARMLGFVDNTGGFRKEALDDIEYIVKYHGEGKPWEEYDPWARENEDGTTEHVLY